MRQCSLFSEFEPPVQRRHLRGDKTRRKYMPPVRQQDAATIRGNESRSTTRSRWGGLRWGLCLVAIALALPGCQSARRGPWAGRRVRGPVRAIWVTRWDYKTPESIAAIMENSHRAGFNTVFFQVRGDGTTMYPSRLEPWSAQFDGLDPGFDPLATACKEAHRRGLSLHAWVNVMPGWFGKKPPKHTKQLYNARPEWFWYDASGRRQPLGWYCSLNPCYPEVRRYLVDVMHEIVSRYPVDGLHLDYLRFPNDPTDAYPGGRVPDYPRDPRTVEMFRRATGRTPDSAPAQWSAWRAEQVTQLLREIRSMTLHTNPRISLTATVGADPDAALRNHFQDARRWIAEGLVDAVVPMNYDADMKTYSTRLTSWTSNGSAVPVITGIMFDKRNERLVAHQVSRAAYVGKHFAAFAYHSLFERLDEKGQPIMDAQSAQRAMLRRHVIPFMRGLADSGG